MAIAVKLRDRAWITEGETHPHIHPRVSNASFNGSVVDIGQVYDAMHNVTVTIHEDDEPWSLFPGTVEENRLQIRTNNKSLVAAKRAK